MNSLLFNIANFLAAVNWVVNIDGKEVDLAAAYPWLSNILEPILNLLNVLLLPLLIIIGTAGSVYAIVLGVNYSRAETADKRDEAKKRMINAVIGIVAMIVLLIILQLFVSNAPSIVQFITGYNGSNAPVVTP